MAYRTNDQYHLDITGYVFAWEDNMPVFIAQPDSEDDVYLPMFSTKTQLVEFFDDIEASYEKIKQIDEPDEFVRSIPRRTPEGRIVRLIVDPTILDDANSRFIEILRRLDS